jgi:hypothetical protein
MRRDDLGIMTFVTSCLIFFTEPPMGVAPNADFPSMSFVISASISAAVLIGFDMLKATPSNSDMLTAVPSRRDTSVSGVVDALSTKVRARIKCFIVVLTSLPDTCTCN